MGTASSTEKNTVCSGAHNPTSFDAANHDVGFSHSLFSFCHPPRLGAWILEPHNVRNRTVGYLSMPTQVKRDGYAEHPNHHLSPPESKRKPNGNVRRYGIGPYRTRGGGFAFTAKTATGKQLRIRKNTSMITLNGRRALTRCFPARRKNKNIACSTPPSIFSSMLVTHHID